MTLTLRLLIRETFKPGFLFSNICIKSEYCRPLFLRVHELDYRLQHEVVRLVYNCVWTTREKPEVCYYRDMKQKQRDLSS